MCRQILDLSSADLKLGRCLVDPVFGIAAALLDCRGLGVSDDVFRISQRQLLCFPLDSSGQKLDNLGKTRH
jgi:hypothetical protein